MSQFAGSRPPWERRPSEQLKPAEPLSSVRGGGRSPYRAGKAFEYSIKSRLERRSYFVMRAAASKGKVDLLAVGMPCVEKGISALFVQCKRRGAIGSEEWNQVFDIAEAYGGWAVVCVKLSERTVGFYRLDARREPRRPGRPWTLFDARDLSEQIPPPTLY